VTREEGGPDGLLVGVRARPSYRCQRATARFFARANGMMLGSTIRTTRAAARLVVPAGRARSRGQQWSPSPDGAARCLRTCTQPSRRRGAGPGWSVASKAYGDTPFGWRSTGGTDRAKASTRPCIPGPAGPGCASKRSSGTCFTSVRRARHRHALLHLVRFAALGRSNIEVEDRPRDIDR
jgi:hypothetical protein